MNTAPKPWPLALLLALTATTSWAAPLRERSVHPLIDLGSGYLLGGSANGRWLKPAQIVRLMKGGERYRVYNSRRFLHASMGSEPKSQGAPCDETLFVEMAPKRGGFALGSSWNALPRAPQLMSPTRPVYINDVAAVLKARGLAHPKVNITQVWRVDLDGDGEPEILISASRLQGRPMSPNHVSSSVSAGDYSIVLLRQVVRGKLRTSVLEGEVHPKGIEFSAPNISTLAGVLDVNGDGKMEILVRSRYYEGNSTQVYEMQGGKPQMVLSEGCGA